MFLAKLNRVILAEQFPLQQPINNKSCPRCQQKLFMSGSMINIDHAGTRQLLEVQHANLWHEAERVRGTRHMGLV